MFWYAMMDRGQTFHCVDTPPALNRSDWPSPEDFQKYEEVINWHDVQPGTHKVLELIGVRGLGCRAEDSHVLKLESKNGSTFPRLRRVHYHIQ